jgi:hypothetical protein
MLIGWKLSELKLGESDADHRRAWDPQSAII